MKTEDRHVCPRATWLPIEKRMKRLGRINHDFQAVFSRQGVHAPPVARDSGIVNRQQHLGLFRDQRFHVPDIDIHRAGIHFAKDRPGPRQHHGVPGGTKGVRRQNHFVARLQIRQ